MPQLKTAAKVRVSIDLTEPFYDRLSSLEVLTEASSKAEVIRDALNIYEYIAQQTAEGKRFLLEDGNGQMEKISFFGVASGIQAVPGATARERATPS